MTSAFNYDEKSHKFSLIPTAINKHKGPLLATFQSVWVSGIGRASDCEAHIAAISKT